MTETPVQQATTACMIDIAPNPVSAGCELTMTARILCEPTCSLVGHHLSVRDASGPELAALELTKFDEQTGASSGSIILRAPPSVGEYAWTAGIEGFAIRDLSYPAAAMTASFSVEAHPTKVNVWGTPPAIGFGERFSLNVGIKCLCGCALPGQPFTIHDETGAEVATGVLGDNVWPGTEALHFATVSARAPAARTLGNRSWSVQFPAPAIELPHAAGSVSFGLTFVSAPEHVVTVEALDIARAPLAGAIVTMHPYRAVTDDRGIAKLQVPKGAYTLFVSARKHLSDRTDVIVTGDLSAQAQLAPEPPRERL